MNRSSIHFIATFCTSAFLLLYAGPSNGQTPATTKANADHCGSSFTEDFVPEQMFGCKMAEACKAHDICYGACDPGGSKHGTDYCKQNEFSGERVAAKQACDTQFFWAIAKTNGNKWQCRAVGVIYTAAVAIAGQGPFNGKPMPPQAMKALVETSATPEEAMSKFKALALEAKSKQLDLSQLQRKGKTITATELQANTAQNGATLQLQRGAFNQEIADALQAWQRRPSASPLLLKKVDGTSGETK
jgi:hypothetical protein